MRDGSFVWTELMTGDVEAARAFYGDVAGWNLVDSGMPGVSYTLAMAGEHRIAGIMGTPPDAGGAPPSWFGYIAAADVDAMAERVVGAGGAIHRRPTDIPGIGRFAVAADPQGAAFMLFRGSGDAPPEIPAGMPGSIGWRELRTSDWQSAFAFYSGLFGWESSYAHDMGPMGIYQTFSIDGTWTGGMMTVTGQAPGWVHYITVADIDAAAARVAAAGGTEIDGPHEVPGGSFIVTARDPQGVRFALTGKRPG